MNEILNHLDAAYRYISSISVSGDSVDKIAAARAMLRKAYDGLKKIDQENAKHDITT